MKMAAGLWSAACMRARVNWLGRLDSNQGMAVPKTAALPLGYAPACIGLVTNAGVLIWMRRVLRNGLWQFPSRCGSTTDGTR